MPPRGLHAEDRGQRKTGVGGEKSCEREGLTNTEQGTSKKEVFVRIQI